MSSYVEQKLQWRVLTPEDLPALKDLRDQIEELDDTVMDAVDPIMKFENLQRFLDDSIGGWDLYGNLLAYGLNITTTATGRLRSLLLGGVHPTHRYLAIGRSILSWQERRAIDYRDEHEPDEELWLGCYCEHQQPGLMRLLERASFTPERLYHDMFRDLVHLPQPNDVPEISFELWSGAHQEEVRRLHNLCFAESRYTHVDVAQWQASLTDDCFSPQWTWVAKHQDRIVGYAITRQDEVTEDGAPTSWTDRLGVHPDYRGRAISTGLLLRGFHSMKADGCVRAGLGVDTNNRRFLDHLEAHLGYRTRDAITLMSKTVGAAG